MSMQEARGTFDRKEVKYRLDAAQRAQLEPLIVEHVPESAYGCSVVNSLYLDLPDGSIIERSLEKPLYKEKLRLRWYGAGPMGSADTVFAELKKKHKGIVYKRRIVLHPDTVRELGAGRVPATFVPARVEGVSQRTAQQIAAEIEAFCQRHAGLGPAALIRCCRRAFEEPGACGLRITVDEQLVGRSAAPGAPWVPLLGRGESVMEVKCHGPYPLWLVRGLDEVRAYPMSFSKYGELHRRRMMAHAG